RQLISIKKQLRDWRVAIEYAKGLGYENIALWGTSFSGGHVLQLSSEIEVSAVVAQVPFVDGMASVRAIHNVGSILTLTFFGLVDRAAALFGKSYRLPIVAEPGKRAFMNTPESIRYLEIIPEGVKWENLAPARIALEVSFYRPIKVVKKIRCPVLYVVAEGDTIAPAQITLEAAKQTPKAEIVKFDGGHFDGYLDLLDSYVEEEHSFFTKHLLS
ncbi:alpha/beta hydrolase, partial [Archaeoglobales archaeon]